jgi:tripartite-type tricarboxylate transporter receptor subunit TctC
MNLFDVLPPEKLPEYCRSLNGSVILNRKQSAIYVSVLLRPGTSEKDIAAWSRTRRKALRLPNVALTLDGSGVNRRRPRYKISDLTRVAELRAVNLNGH